MTADSRNFTKCQKPPRKKIAKVYRTKKVIFYCENHKKLDKFYLNMTKLVPCYNRGCGQMFEEEKNSEGLLLLFSCIIFSPITSF